MSSINNEPFIVKVLSSLTSGQAATLKSLINGGDGDFVFKTLKPNQSATLSVSDKGISKVLLELSGPASSQTLYQGYLIYNDSYCVLISYAAKGIQQLVLINIDVESNPYKYQIKNCELSITELRSELDDTSESEKVEIIGVVQDAIDDNTIKVASTNIDSGETTAEGKVLTADGHGGASWESGVSTIKNADVEDGTAIKMIGFDSEGNVIKQNVPVGLGLATQLDVNDTTHALNNAATTTALNNKADKSQVYTKTEVDEALANKCNPDGDYSGSGLRAASAEVADNLTPYSENSGANDTTPFVSQSTGGSSDVGSQAYLKALRGNTVVLNQLCNNATASQTINGVTFTNNGDGSYTVNGTATADTYKAIQPPMTVLANHKYLIRGAPSGSSYETFALVDSYSWVGGYGGESGKIATTSTNKTFQMSIFVKEGATVTNKVFLANVFDLTLMFGAGNEPTSVLEFNRLFPKPYYYYNAGKLLSCKVNGIKNVGYNAFDGELEVGALGSNGEEVSASTAIRSSNFIKVISGQKYTYEINNPGSNTISNYMLCEYDANKNFISRAIKYSNNSQFELSNNTRYVRFCSYCSDSATISGVQIAFHLTWDGSRTGFEPYSSKTYALPNIELRSTGSVYDELKPDGTITRRVGYVDLGSIDGWANYGTGGTTERVTTSALSSLIKSTSANVKANLTTSKFIAITYNSLYNGNDGIAVDGTTLYIKDTSVIGKTTNTEIKQALSGVLLYYELAEPTEEQTSNTYPEIQDIDDFGTQEFLYDSDIDIPIPQGNDFFYPVDYKAFIDTLYNSVDGDGQNILPKVVKVSGSLETLASGSPESLKQVLDYIDNLHNIEQENIGGALRHQLADKASIDFNNTAYVDLGSLNWTYTSTTDHEKFECVSLFQVIKRPADNTTPGNILCSIYRTKDYSSVHWKAALSIAVKDDGIIYVYDANYTDATTFKNAMKGILLAYEKGE